ncbi:hypothetical protein MBLNU230_g1433t1 [Neophaeotheca triangularis]
MTSDDERPPKQRRLSNGEKFDSSTAKDEVNVEELSHKVPTGDSRSEEATKPSSTASLEQTKSDINAKDVTPLVAPSETQSTQAPTAGQTETEKPLSKNQQRKLRKKAEWEAGREERKVVRKEKTAARRERKKEAKREAASSGTQVAQQSQDRGGKRHRSLRPVQLPVTFVIDCDFDNLMTDNERVSLASQVTRCYSDNKNAHFRAHLTISSFGGHLKERYDGLLAGVHKSWRGTRFLQCNFVETAEKAKEWMSEIDGGGMLKGAFEPLADSAKEDEGRKLKEQGEIVYLTSEADEELEELKPYSTYVIGGLVDKNREKGICYRRAVEAGVKTARLPIGKYLEMQSRKVLTTNHVHEIMVKWLECRDWGEAFMKVIPKRKGGKLKGEEEEGNEDDNDPEVGAEKKSDEAPKAEAEIVNVAPMNGDSQAKSEFEAEADTSEEVEQRHPDKQNNALTSNGSDAHISWEGLIR